MNDRPPKWNPPPVLQCRASDNSEPASLPPCTNDYTVKLVVRLEPEALKQLKEMAGGSNKRPTAFARDILYNAIGFQPAAKKEKVFAPEPPCATEKPRGVGGTSYSDADVMALFDRGFSMSAIAAIMKIPYRQVATIIGNQADEMARRAQF